MKKPKYTYEEIFQRNIGIFTREEQEKIKNLKVAIAGAGGLGGMAAYTLTRLGVGEIRICDPEDFEVSNLNRQYASNVETVGINKAVAVEKELKKINPEIKTTCWDCGINPENVMEFIEGVDVIIDGIDFYKLEAAITLQDAARKKGIWVMVSQIAGSIASYLYIKPGSPNFGDLFFDEKGLNPEKMLKALFPIMPREATSEILDEIKSGKIVAIPSWAHAPIITTLFLVEDLVSAFVKEERELPVSPKVQYIDIFKKEFVET